MIDGITAGGVPRRHSFIMLIYYLQVIMKIFFISILVFSFGQAMGQEANAIKSARAIGAMHAQYRKDWYPNVTFVQAAIFYKDGKVEKEETWYEAVSGRDGLVIKLNDIKGGNGVMYSGDSQYVWRDNKIVTRIKRLNDLYVLGFSVYTDDPSITI